MKVFCIGLSKTGTTSCGAALRMLGFRHFRDVNLMPGVAAGRLDRVQEISHRYEAFDDLPWPMIYRQLAAWHPDARFILTVRDEDSWFCSLCRHARGKGATGIRQAAYGAEWPHENEAHYRDLYRRHNDEVRTFFVDEPDRLLIASWPAGDGWPELCAFLDNPQPDKPFPHEKVACGPIRQTWRQFRSAIRDQLR